MSPEEQPLRATLAISNAEAITGTNRTLNLPSGQQIRVFVPAGAYDGQVIRLENPGEPTNSGGSTITLIFTLTIAQVEETHTSASVGSDEQTVRASSPNIQGPIPPGSQGIAGFPQEVPLYPPPPPQQPPVYVPPYYSPSPSIPAFTPMSGHNIPPSPSGSHAKTILLIVLIFLIIASGVGLFYIIQTNQTGTTNVTTTATTSNLNATSTAQVNATIRVATATAQANATTNAAATATIIAQNPDPYPPNNGVLTLYDSLSQPSSWSAGSDTFGSTCQFTNAAYHLSTAKSHYFFYCTASATNFSNFAFEVQMTIHKGDCGGMVFREDSITNKYYQFEVCQNGSYGLFLYVDNTATHAKTLRTNTSSAIHKGLNQSNVVAVVANGNTLTLYVNNQKIDSISDSTYSHGQIGLVATDLSTPTEVIYTNAKVWR